MVAKLKATASTLVETLVAILMITVVFGISLGIYDQVLLSNQSNRKERALIAIDKVLQEIKRSPVEYRNKVSVLPDEGFDLKIDVTQASNFSGVLLVTIKAVDPEEKLITKRIVVLADEEG